MQICKRNRELSTFWTFSSSSSPTHNIYHHHRRIRYNWGENESKRKFLARFWLVKGDNKVRLKTIITSCLVKNLGCTHSQLPYDQKTFSFDWIWNDSKRRISQFCCPYSGKPAIFDSAIMWQLASNAWSGLRCTSCRLECPCDIQKFQVQKDFNLMRATIKIIQFLCCKIYFTNISLSNKNIIKVLSAIFDLRMAWFYLSNISLPK